MADIFTISVPNLVITITEDQKMDFCDRDHKIGN